MPDDDAPQKDGVASKGARLWGGRFEADPASAMEEFTSSLAIDRRLYPEDITGSIAHARMLGATGIIPRTEAQQLIRGLKAVRREFDEGTFAFADGDEDIHTAIERRLSEQLGPDIGGKLQTGRSRNDQVALDLRMYAKSAIVRTGALICKLQAALVTLAENHVETVMPAYTHMQRAQPTTLAHHLLAYVAMLQRDFDRLQDAYDRADIMPLGSAAATGTSLPLNRELVAKELDFTSISQNSLDAVSDRDFVVEIQAASALVMVHLSRLGEELVLWSSQEFGFIELPDDFATGSSLMPQKKNPDVPELVRGRTGRVIGELTSMLTTLKGLPLAYNRDLQGDKESFFTTVDTTQASLEILAQMIPRLGIRVERMLEAASDPQTMATEVADYLVLKGVPFRRAHEVVGKAVRKAQDKKISLAELDLKAWRALDPAFDDGVSELFDPRRAIARRHSTGTPGPAPVKRALVRALLAIKINRQWLTTNNPRS